MVTALHPGQPESISMPMRPDDITSWLRQVAPGAQLSSDSRSIAPGDVFLAYPGDTSDGRRYIEQAIARGAQAVLYEEQGLAANRKADQNDADKTAAGNFEWDHSLAVAHRAVAGLRALAGPIAAAWYGQPDRDMLVVGVTGTNGKTSCSQWLGYALSQVDGPVAVVGTLGAGLWSDGKPGEFNATGFTTPDPVQLQRRLSELRAAGAWALAIEASSIGLQQHRLDGLHFDIGLFTNLTRDHLDYHGDMAAYEQAKAVLFDWPGLRHAVINLDDPMGRRLRERLKARPEVSVIGYTVRGETDPDIAVLSAADVRSTQVGTGFTLTSPYGAGPVRTQLVGHFNVSNVLGIAGVLLARDLEWQTAIDLIESLQSVPGRMQQLGGQDAPLVVIDYAHTPDALDKTLTALRQVAQDRNGKLWCVFGCGGDRDAGKRPQMGAVAMAADEVVLTSDNPRNEEPAEIMRQVMAGMSRQPLAIEDRAAAILWAIRHSSRADVVLLAGKGHENYQEIKGRKQMFLDADHAALALLSRATMKGNN